jgi:hypothetical protein
VKSFARPIALFTTCLIGCRHSGGGGANAAPNQASVGTAIQQNGDVLNRLPAPVAAAFQKNHPRLSPTRIHVRLFPDGTTHYQVIYLGNDGQTHQAEYYPDGRNVP